MSSVPIRTIDGLFFNFHSFMRPDTHHAVITIENSIVAGEHFYACATLSRSVAGYVHTAMLDFSITNILHLELRPLLLRMMCYFSQNICSKNSKVTLCFTI